MFQTFIYAIHSAGSARPSMAAITAARSAGVVGVVRDLTTAMTLLTQVCKR